MIILFFHIFVTFYKFKYQSRNHLFILKQVAKEIITTCLTEKSLLALDNRYKLFCIFFIYQ